MSEAIQAEAKAQGGTVRLLVERSGGIRETVLMKARSEQRGEQSFWLIGVAPEMREAVRRYGPLEAIPQAFAETLRLTTGACASSGTC